MGDMNKTNFEFRTLTDCVDDYSSVFWVNAKDETSLKQSMADLSAAILSEFISPPARSADDERLQIGKTRRWLSEPAINQWLLTFHNYLTGIMILVSRK